MCVACTRGGHRCHLDRVGARHGYTGSGAAGIYKAALVALCQQYNYGYKTVFDRNVDRFYTEITPRVNYAVSRPSAEDYGFFMKEVCTALGQPSIGGVGIVAHMRAQTQLVLVESGRLPDGVLYIYIKYATSAGCMPYDTWLPPVVQMSG